MKELERGVVESAAGFCGSPQWRQGLWYGVGLSGVNLMLLASYTAILTTIYHYIKVDTHVYIFMCYVPDHDISLHQGRCRV